MIALAALTCFGLGASSAHAMPAPYDTTFALDGSSFFAIGNQRFYSPTTEFNVHVEDVGGGLFSLTFTNFFFPVIDAGSEETFETTVDGNMFTAIYDPSDHSVVVETITVDIVKKQEGVSTLTGTFTFDITTGAQSRPQCGSTPGSTAFGSPLNPGTGEMTLLASDCIHQLGSDQAFNQVFVLKLVGVLGDVPVAAPEPAAALLLGLGLLALARIRRA